MPAASQRRLAHTAWVGALAWLALLANGVFHEVGEALVALGLGCVVPLGASCATVLRADGRSPRSESVASWCVPFGVAAGLASFCVPVGAPAAALAAVWLLATISLAVAALARLARRGVGPLEETAIDLGHLYLPIGAAWLLASRAGLSPMGFVEPIVLYTAAHFHYAGFAAPVVLGLLGRELGGRASPDDPDAPVAAPARWRVFRGTAAVVMAGVPLVAVGITVSRALEGPAAVVLGAAMLSASALLVRAGVARITRGSSSVTRWSGGLLALSGASLVLSMGFAIAFALTGSAGRQSSGGGIPYPTMAAVHGVANALGFSLSALLAFALVAPPRRLRPLGMSLPRIVARGFVGPDFFDRIGAVDPSRPVRGQLDALDRFAHAGFDPQQVHPSVRAFYERTEAYALHVAPRWHWPFGLPAAAFHVVARRALGQLELPLVAEGAEPVATRLFALRDGLDGRSDARGYVRSYGARAHARANYVAAYATHTSDVCTHLSCAFPLPFSALLGVLRFEQGTRAGGLSLTSEAPQEGAPGDEGMFLATALGAVRLPIEERIDVWPDGTTLRAEHRVRVLGLPCVTLTYTLRPRDAADAPPGATD